MIGLTQNVSREQRTMPIEGKDLPRGKYQEIRQSGVTISLPVLLVDAERFAPFMDWVLKHKDDIKSWELRTLSIFSRVPWIAREHFFNYMKANKGTDAGRVLLMETMSPGTMASLEKSSNVEVRTTKPLDARFDQLPKTERIIAKRMQVEKALLEFVTEQPLNGEGARVMLVEGFADQIIDLASETKNYAMVYNQLSQLNTLAVNNNVMLILPFDHQKLIGVDANAETQTLTNILTLSPTMNGLVRSGVEIVPENTAQGERPLEVLLGITRLA